MWVADFSTANGTTGRPSFLFESRYDLAAKWVMPQYDVLPDGSGFLMLTDTSIGEIRVVKNWLEELKRLVPTD